MKFHKVCVIDGKLNGILKVKKCNPGNLPAWNVRLTRDNNKVTCKECIKLIKKSIRVRLMVGR